MKIHYLFVKGKILAALLVAGLCGQLQAENWSYIENAEVKLGVDLDRGACIGYFSELSPANNVLNYYDTGRFLQQSYYGDEDGSSWAGNDWRYNPVQGGGYLASWPATTLAYVNTGDSIYAKVRPRHWATGEELYDVVMEEWITLEGNVAHIRYKMTYNDETMASFVDQEMPACFTDYDFNQLVFYNGDSPWTGGALNTVNVPGSDPPSNTRENNLSENWAAYMNSSTQWGVGLYSPGSSILTYYRSSAGSGEVQTSYFGPLQQFRLINGGIVDYDVYLTVGTIGEIRDAFTGIHTNNLAEDPLLLFEDTFDASAAVWNNPNTDLPTRQAGGTASSTYTLTASSATALLIGQDGGGLTKPALIRVNTTGGANEFTSLDLDTDFGPDVQDATWSLSYRSRLDPSVVFSGWTGFSVGNPAEIPDGAGTGLGIKLFKTGEFQIWNAGVNVHTGNIGNTAAQLYDLTATFDEGADTVTLTYFYQDAPSYSVDMGTYSTAFIDDSRFIELRNHVDTSAGVGVVDWRVDDLRIFMADAQGDARLMENESVVFCSDLQPLTAQLLFKPLEIQTVQRADRSEAFEEGVDYTVDANGLITLTPASQIPVLDYYAAVTDPVYYRFTDIYGTPFYSAEGTHKHVNYDVVVTYTHTEGSLDELAVGSWATGLTTPITQLQAQQPLNITFFGDSITYGAQASSLAPGAEPFAPAYPLQVVDALKARFGYGQINYANKAVGGKTSTWGLQEIQQVIDTAPDLVVLAFGMNDAGVVPTATYKQNTEDMILALRAANPNVGIVLVAEFSPNPEWGGANYALRAINRDSLHDLYSTYGNMAFVDVGAVSRPVADQKKFQDFSGNTINHPNDFLHRIYADLILNVFGEWEAPPENWHTLFEDIFDTPSLASGGVWNNLNTSDLATSQAGGSTGSTYTLGLFSGTTLIGPAAASALGMPDPVLVRVNTAGGLGGTTILDLDTDFGSDLAGQTWSLSYSGLLVKNVGFSGWTGFSVGNPADTADGAGTGLGIKLFTSGEFQVWNAGANIHTGNLGFSIDAARYDLTATFDERAGNVILNYSDASHNFNMGTYSTAFVDDSRFIELRNHVDTSTADGVVDWRVDDLVVRMLLDIRFVEWAGDNELVGADAELGADPDEDGLVNLAEYALGGNPNLDDAVTFMPDFAITDAGGGSNVMGYIYNRRLNAAALGLTYGLNMSTNLQSAWIYVSNAYETGSTDMDLYFESVSNSIPVSGSQGFVNLEITRD